jgi:hypothetical protein
MNVRGTIGITCRNLFVSHLQKLVPQSFDGPLFQWIVEIVPIPNLFPLRITNGDNVIYRVEETLDLGDGEFKATTSFCHFNGGRIF